MSLILQGDALQKLKTLPDESCRCCVTSPPYYGLRDYGVDNQIGLEDSADKYIAHLVAVFHEVRRVIANDGTLWIVMGDSYAGSGKGAWKNKSTQKEAYVPEPGSRQTTMPKKWDEIKPKDLIGIPWMLAFALRSDGWYLRQDIIWNKPNAMPESVRDRCTKSHEYIFLLSKSSRYFYNAGAIAEPAAESTMKRLKQDIKKQKGSFRIPGKTNGPMKAVVPRYKGDKYTNDPDNFFKTKSGNIYKYRPKRNKRDVWIVTTQPFKQAHFATFPPELIRPCVLAGSMAGDTILDPFFGSGTTGVVATQESRHYIGIDLNPDYVNMSIKRIKAVPPPQLTFF